LRKRIQGAVNRQRSGAQPVPPRQQKQRKHTSTGLPSDTVLRRHSFVVSQALQLLCLSPTVAHREFAYEKLLALPRISVAEGSAAHPAEYQLPAFTAGIAGSLEDALFAATGYRASVFGAAVGASAGAGDAFAAGGAAAARAFVSGAGAGGHAVDADWHQRTATYRAIVETNLIGLFPVALSSNARTADIEKDLLVFVVLVFVLRNFVEGCTKPRRCLWYEYPGVFESAEHADTAVRLASLRLLVPERRMTIMHDSRGVIFGPVRMLVNVSSTRFSFDFSENSLDGTTVPSAICHQLVEDDDVTICHKDSGISLEECVVLVCFFLCCIFNFRYLTIFTGSREAHHHVQRHGLFTPAPRRH
jgi:hypothetical protein